MVGPMVNSAHFANRAARYAIRVRASSVQNANTLAMILEIQTRRLLSTPTKRTWTSDTLAWALHKNGKNEETADAGKQARRLGTRDAALHYHAGMIHLALGENEEGKELLRAALLSSIRIARYCKPSSRGRRWVNKVAFTNRAGSDLRA